MVACARQRALGQALAVRVQHEHAAGGGVGILRRASDLDILQGVALESGAWGQALEVGDHAGHVAAERRRRLAPLDLAGVDAEVIGDDELTTERVCAERPGHEAGVAGPVDVHEVPFRQRGHLGPLGQPGLLLDGDVRRDLRVRMLSPMLMMLRAPLGLCKKKWAHHRPPDGAQRHGDADGPEQDEQHRPGAEDGPRELPGMRAVMARRDLGVGAILLGQHVPTRTREEAHGLEGLWRRLRQGAVRAGHY
mmetsp:Transcript_92210/g.237983  ORF Transcript_92210/g.237983 Transcript_92210/m.237983 type:complete len:250 (+) Transcript_92210:979-1728(+)